MTTSPELTSAPERQPSKGLRHLVARNIFWNWAGMIIEMAAGFLVAPYLVRRLGVTSYGLWIVIGSFTGYFALLDLGLRGSVGRQLAYYRGNSNLDGVNNILNSALAMFMSVATVTVIATSIAVLMFDRIMDIPSDQLSNARIALALVGLNLALSFPLQVFDGYLWAAQRFDILNLVDIPASIVRVLLTLTLVKAPGDIVTLSVITLVTQAGSGVVKGVISFRTDKFLRIRARFISREAAYTLFNYGWWNFVLTIARLTKTQLSPVLIGSIAGVAQVTPFSIARRLQDYGHKVLWTATGVIVPVATGFHARSEVEQQQRLFIQGGKYSASASLFMVTYLVCVGRSLIALWMGPQFMYVAVLLSILSLGELVQMTQSLTGSIILATARHKALAWMAIVEAVVSIAAIAVFSKPYGLVGICLALAIPQFLLSGVGTLLYGCKVTGVPLGTFSGKALWPAAASAAIPVACLVGVIAWHSPDTWPRLILYTIGYFVIYLASCWVVLKPPFSNFGLRDVKTALLN